jgi:hypothetical protein
MKDERRFTIPAVWLVDMRGKKDATFANALQDNRQALAAA